MRRQGSAPPPGLFRVATVFVKSTALALKAYSLVAGEDT